MEILNYLKEYESLCKKYNFNINGCGCCGSPFIELEDNKNNIYYLENIKLNNNNLIFDIRQTSYGDMDGNYLFEADVNLEWLEHFINNNFS